MSGRRVVVTGVGVITSVGQDRESLWQSVLAGRCGIRLCDRFDTSPYRAKCAAQVDDFDPTLFFPARRLKRLARYAQMSLVCAVKAARDARLELDPRRKDPRAGICTGTALGGISAAEEQHELFLHQGIRAINPMLAILVFGGSSSSTIAIELGFTGVNHTNSNSCASGTMALGDAFRHIRDNRADLIIAGGAEAPLYPLTYTAFDLIRTMSEQSDPSRASRPFDLNRDGFVMGEGAAMLVLESLDRARARGAEILAEVSGFACNSDAYHMTASLDDGSSAARCMSDALAEARLPPDQIDYINPHASSTQMNDRNETTAIRSVFGPRTSEILVSGTKGLHGHPLGASGAIEAAITALALSRRTVPGNVGLTDQDPACDLNIPRDSRPAKLRAAISNSFGFGGINATIVLKAFES